MAVKGRKVNEAGFEISDMARPEVDAE